MSANGCRVVFTGPGVAEMEQFDVPVPAEGQAVVRSERTVISAGTEHTSLLGQLSAHRGYPVYPGYSNVGVVEAVGPGVERPAVGERVLTMAGHCSHHLIDLAPTRPGSPTYWQPVPEGIDPEAAAFSILGSVAMHGVRKAGLQLGEAVAVFGAGIVGQLTLQMAQWSGCGPIIAVDYHDDRLERARQSGATFTVNAGRRDVVEAILAFTGGRGADVLFEATRGGTALPVMMHAAAKSARLMIVGSIPDKIEIDPFTDLQLKELQIGCFQPAAPLYGHPSFPWTQSVNRLTFLEMLETGQMRVEHLISHRLPYYSAPKAYTLIQRDRSGWLGIVIDWEVSTAARA